jgi:hypothetical protein
MLCKIASVLDRFGFTPFPRYRGGSQISALSLTGTLIVFAITLAYSILVWQRFSRQTPTISLTSTFEPNAANLTLPRFGVSVQPPTGGECNYSIQFFKQTEVGSQSAFTPLEQESCQFPGMVVANSTVYCPVEAVEIAGARSVSSNYSTVVVFVDETSYGTSCGQAEVGLLVDQGGRTFSFQVLSEVVDPSQPPKLHGVCPIYQMPFLQHETVDSPNLLTTFKSSSTFTMTGSQLNYVGNMNWDRVQKYDSSSSGSSVQRRLMIFRLFYSGEHITEEREYQTSLDVIGQCFAFYGAVLAGFAVLLRWYNERKFYIENPSWDSFDGQFVRAPTTEESLGQEMTPTSHLAKSLLTDHSGTPEA